MNFQVKNYKMFYLFITAVCLVVYFQTINFDLVFCDDHDIILNNVNKIKDFSNFPNNLFEGYLGANYFRPVVILSFMIDYMISGDNATMYHVTNLIFHIIFCLLLFNLLQKLEISKQLAFLSSIIYAVHPIFTNSISWIVGRNDVLFSIFLMLSFIYFLKYLTEIKKIQFVVHLIFMFIAFLSKETAFVFPLILTLYLMLIVKKSNIRNILSNYLIYWIGVITIYLILRSFVNLGDDINNYGFDVFLLNLRVFPEFFAKLILPYNMSVLPTYTDFNTYVGLVLLILFITIAIKYTSKENRNWMIFGFAWAFIVILPGTLFTLKNSPDWNEYLDTRFYFAVVGILIVIANLKFIKLLNFNKRSVVIITVLVISLLAVRNISISKDYSNALLYYKNAVEHDDSRLLFNYILSNLYLDLKNFDAAEKHKKRTVELRPESIKYNFDLSMFFINSGKIPESIIYLNKTIALDSSKKDTYDALAQAYINQKETQKAIHVLTIAIEHFPNSLQYYDYLSYSYLMQNNIEQAIESSEKLIGRDYSAINLSNDFIYYSQMVLYERKQYELYIKLLNQSIKLAPNNVETYKYLVIYYRDIKRNQDMENHYLNKLDEITKKVD